MGRLEAMSSGNNFKLVLLGEGRVGKTSTVLRYVHDKFDDRTQATIQASFLNKRLSVAGAQVNIAIWDTAGQERFHALGPIYYRDADGALLVYDITDVDSFTKVKQWVKELRKMVGPNIQISVAGNKIDLPKTSRVVSDDEVQAFCTQVGGVHHATSAKTGKGINEMFLDITTRILSTKNQASTGR